MKRKKEEEEKEEKGHQSIGEKPCPDGDEHLQEVGQDREVGERVDGDPEPTSEEGGRGGRGGDGGVVVLGRGGRYMREGGRKEGWGGRRVYE